MQGVSVGDGIVPLAGQSVEFVRRIPNHGLDLLVPVPFREQLPCPGEVVGYAAVLEGEAPGTVDPTVFPPYLGVPGAITDHLRVGHLGLELGVASLDPVDQGTDHLVGG